MGWKRRRKSKRKQSAEQDIDKESGKIVALAGNPNVGKSTVFNALTGLNQHTGNWTGKTVDSAYGICNYHDENYIMVDLPGTYSLMAHSAEEEVARNFICFKHPDATIVVCDATCLERNLNLVLQTIELTKRVVVCVNLLDEAKKKQICVDLDKLSKELGVPVIGTTARSKKGLDDLLATVEALARDPEPNALKINYIPPIEEAISMVEPHLAEKLGEEWNCRWIAIRLLEGNTSMIDDLNRYIGYDVQQDNVLADTLAEAKNYLNRCDITEDNIKDKIVACLVITAEGICANVVSYNKANCHSRDRKIDKYLTNRFTGIPIMIALLALIFWITISGANYPSQMLSEGLFWVQDRLTDFFMWMHAPEWLHGALVLGVYRVLAWVVSVMLPPMAIFFPLFTLLEDFGYLPRVAFNLDHYFKKANTCGKQALTMCMGFGCNAAGVVGCRIIDSPRERMIAMLTNNFVPCNGRFPTMISIISMFFVGSIATGFTGSLLSTLMLTGVIILGVMLTFAMSKLLSKTVLKGVPSSFTLELPPYRRPQIGKVIVRSLLDRTIFVLGRAVIVAAPAGFIIWILANVTAGDATLLSHCAAFLDPFGKLFGLDGTILFAFILGFPANEIVVPIMIMTYMATGTLTEIDDLMALKELLVANNWTWVTALCVIVFSLVHWPCSTTCLSIKKETKSWKWTAIGFLLPTVTGFGLCFVIATFARIFGGLV